MVSISSISDVHIGNIGPDIGHYYRVNIVWYLKTLNNIADISESVYLKPWVTEYIL